MKASLLLFTSFCVAEFFCFIQDFPFYFQISHSLGSDSHYGTPRDLRMFQEILFAEGGFLCHLVFWVNHHIFLLEGKNCVLSHFFRHIFDIVLPFDEEKVVCYEGHAKANILY